MKRKVKPLPEPIYPKDSGETLESLKEKIDILEERVKILEDAEYRRRIQEHPEDYYMP